MEKAVFLDRDGVINDNKRPVNKPEDLVFFPWTFEALKLLNDMNLPIFIVTNQGGIEMGYFSDEDLQSIHKYMLNIFKDNDITIDDIAYCPHFKTKCDCRKPAPGMLLNLAQKHNIDLNNSYMVGDRDMDIEAGAAAGCTTIKIGSYYEKADHNVSNLLEVVDIISKF